ncbi:MAG: hypothetical protein SFX73_10655, partial [Kofleriaceae bacterium]|nr:hypothetical protein [Kofleriaceae bacterium]
CDIDRQGTGLSRPAPRERSGTGTGTGTGTGAGRENRRGAAFLSALLGTEAPTVAQAKAW